MKAFQGDGGLAGFSVLQCGHSCRGVSRLSYGRAGAIRPYRTILDDVGADPESTMGRLTIGPE